MIPSDVLAILLGAVAKGFISGQVARLTGLSPEISGGVAGILLYLFGDRIHPLLKPFGLGVLAGSIAPAVAKALGLPASSSSSPEEIEEVAMSPREYIWLTYGV